jgi:hypothetical protein
MNDFIRSNQRAKFEAWARRLQLDPDSTELIVVTALSAWQAALVAAQAEASMPDEKRERGRLQGLRDAINIIDLLDDGEQSEYRACKEGIQLVINGATARLRAAMPNADCSGEPANCPDNEGHGCACSATALAGSQCEVCADTGVTFGKQCACKTERVG